MFNKKKDVNGEPNTAPETVETELETEETAEAAAEDECCEPNEPDNEPEADKADPLAQELAQAKENYLRLAAEYENYRKRTQREKEALSAEVKSATVAKLLPILDNIDLALTFDGADENTILKGVELIKQQAVSIFGGLGITPFCEVGDSFDPNLHNCIGMVPSEELESGQVTLVVQKGYKLGDRIIRPAMVQIAE